MSGAEQGGAAGRAQEVEEERPDELQEEGAEAVSAERWGKWRRDARVNRGKGDLSSKAVYVTKKNIDNNMVNNNNVKSIAAHPAWRDDVSKSNFQTTSADEPPRTTTDIQDALEREVAKDQKKAEAQNEQQAHTA